MFTKITNLLLGSTLFLAAPVTHAFPVNRNPGYVSYNETNNPADIVSSTRVGNDITSKVDAINGQASGLVLDGPPLRTSPPDRPGAAGTAIPDTIWVDSNYASRNWFITQNVTLNVCPSGCTYTNPLDAWYATFAVTPVNGAIITIQIADGTYNLANQFYTELPHTKSVHILGNITAPTKVVLNFTHTQGTNLCGFAAYNGGLIGSIDGITIQAPLDGTGSLASTDSRGRHFGAGISFNGAGSSIHLGNHIIVKGFYYSLVADNNAGIDAPNGGMGMPIAGDVNAMARGGGVIVCTPWYSKRR